MSESKYKAALERALKDLEEWGHDSRCLKIMLGSVGRCDCGIEDVKRRIVEVLT